MEPTTSFETMGASASVYFIYKWRTIDNKVTESQATLLSTILCFNMTKQEITANKENYPN